MAALGKHIKTLRNKQHLSQAQLSQRSGIKREYISYLERGKLKNPTLNTLNKIASGLGVPLEKLVRYDSVEVSAFQDLLEKSAEIEQKISLLKNNLRKLTNLLNCIEEKTVITPAGKINPPLPSAIQRI